MRLAGLMEAEGGKLVVETVPRTVGCKPPGKVALRNPLLQETFAKVDGICNFMHLAETRHGVDLQALGEEALRLRASFDPSVAMARYHAQSESHSASPVGEEAKRKRHRALSLVKLFGLMMGYVDSRKIPGAFEQHTMPRALAGRMALSADNSMRVLADDVLQARGD